MIIACSEREQIGSEPESLYTQPKTVSLKLNQADTIKSIFTDSIKPIIFNKGDTLVTGKAILTDGKIVHSDSLLEPIKTPCKPPTKVYPANSKIFQLEEPSKQILIYEDSLTKVYLENSQAIITKDQLSNSKGEIIQTGVPLELVPKKITPILNASKSASEPRYKDVFSRDIKFLDVNQGMASSYVFGILEDKRGNIWFANHFAGISKYNGNSFTHFTTKEGLIDNSVLSIMEDHRGNIWMGFNNGGICMYDGKYFNLYQENQGFTNYTVMDIYEDSELNIWFGTKGAGAIKYNGHSFTYLTTNEGLSSNSINCITQDQNNNMWFGTSDKGVNKFDGKVFTHLTSDNGLKSNSVWSILNDRNDNIWFGTDGAGVYKYDRHSLINYSSHEGLSHNSVFSILEDKTGNLWFGTWGGGLNKFDGNNFTQITEEDGLSNNSIFHMLEDRAGNIWLATYGGGVSILKENSFNHLNKIDPLSKSNTHAIIEDRKSNLWFGTWGNGICRFDGKEFTFFDKEEGLSHNVVLSIIEDKNGDLWFGTRGAGVSKFNGETFTHFSKKSGLSGNVVISLFEDSKGNIWMGTEDNGITVYDGTKFRHFTEQDGIHCNNVNCFNEDKLGNIWFGTKGGGLVKYDGNSFIHFTQYEGLMSNDVTSILIDLQDNIWFSSYQGGLSFFDGENFTHFSENEGLLHNTITSLAGLSRNNESEIWIGTQKGLNHLRIDSSNQTLAAPVFLMDGVNKFDGLNGLDFIPNSVCIDSRNQIWWGTGKGVTMLDLIGYSRASSPPIIQMTDLLINENFHDYQRPADQLKSAIGYDSVQSFSNYPINLCLDHKYSHLTFCYTATDWSAPNKIRYSYMLEGLNQEWSTPTQDTKVVYRNLEYGSYTFKLKAIGSSGEWSETFEYDFVILRPWWHQWWARTLYMILTILIIYGFLKIRMRKLKQRQKQLEVQIKLATQKISEQKKVAEQQRDLVKQSFEEAEKQKIQIEKAHKEITDSINYAERIQQSFMATADLLEANLPEYFIYFNPKETVSGDFYWAANLANDKFAISCADSTGHGVPGAIMSILNISALEKSIENGTTKANEIFNQARTTIIERLKKDGSKEGGKDGMDATLLLFNPDKSKLEYVAANNPIWIIREGELIVIKGERMPVGKNDLDHTPFKGGEFNLKKGDIIYTMTDGFQDQFGGPKEKKFKTSPLKNLILQNAKHSMNDQRSIIAETFQNWKGDLEQVDDVCIIGIKI